MGAPKDAYVLKDHWDEGPESLAKAMKNKGYRVQCHCGWLGHWPELLGADDTETLWCPQCRCSGWGWD